MGMGGGMPDLGALQQQLMQNPQMMQQMMASPMFQQLTANPDLVRTMMQSNPAIQDLIRRNPEVGHVLNDPELLRQSLDAARNPALQQELLRQQDRALSNVEAMPGGLNLLSRMYTDVQEPLLDAAAQQMQGLAGAPAAAPENPFAALLNPSAPNTQPLPSPWAPPAPAPAVAPAAARSAGGLGGGMGMGAGFGGMPPGMGGMGLPPGMTLEMMQQMLASPAVQQSMRDLAANPEHLRAMFAMHPMMSDPGVRAQMEPLLANPAMLQQMMDPATLQALIQLQGAMGGMGGMPGMAGTGGGVGASTGSGSGGSTAPASSSSSSGAPAGGVPGMPFGFPFMPFGFPPAAAAPAAAPAAPAQPPAEGFAAQLVQLREMGFYDEAENIQVLLAVNGNVSAAIERLLQG